MQFNTRNGVRCNTRMAYLDPARGRVNLTLKTGAMVSRILLQGTRANGVQARIDGREVTLHARREVILCGGTFNSSQLLELSGIGRREVLSHAGVPLVHELPMVGENLSEHVYSPVVFRARREVSWNRALNSPLAQAGLAARWLVKRDGPMSSVTITAHAFAPKETGGKDAEVKIQIQQVSSPGNRGAGKILVDDFDGVTIASFQIRPRSRGTSHIGSNDPNADPIMVSNHFTHPDDLDACLTAFKLSRKIAATGPMARLLEGEVRPGAKDVSDEALVRLPARKPAPPPTTRWARAESARMPRIRWSTRSCGCTAVRACASRTVRSCPASQRPIPMRLPS